MADSNITKKALTEAFLKQIKLSIKYIAIRYGDMV